MATTVVNIKHGEEYDVYIGRPSKWGNPFKIGLHGTRRQVVEKYRRWLMRPTREGGQMRGQLRELKDKRLGCFCKPKPCHGDVLVEMVGMIVG